MNINIIEKDRISTGKNAAVIRVVAPVQSGSKKSLQSGNVLPYILVVGKIGRKQSRFLRSMEKEWSKSQ